MVCQVCGKEQRWSDVVPALLVRDSIVETIQTTPARGFDRGRGGRHAVWQLPQGGEFRRRIESAGVVRRITFETQAVTGWNSGRASGFLEIPPHAGGISW
jgi:hypothetical protein